MTLPETLYAYRLHRSNPSSYYYQIADIQKSFFEKRWRRLFPDADYPETQCERLRYLQTHNNGLFRQSLLDNMFQTHCQDNRFNPTGAGWFLPLPTGGEWVVASQNTKRFYSDRLQKYGVLVSGTDDQSVVRWDGDTDVTVYHNR